MQEGPHARIGGLAAVNEFVTGLFSERPHAGGARRLLVEAGCRSESLALFGGMEDGAPSVTGLLRPTPVQALRRRPEAIFRTAVRGAIIGALAVELPVALGVFLLSVDASVQVFLASTVWKIGVVLGGLLGVLLGQVQGLESDMAQRYENNLREGFWLLVAHVSGRQLPQVRGVLLESGALEVREGEGTFEPKRSPRAQQMSSPA